MSVAQPCCEQGLAQMIQVMHWVVRSQRKKLLLLAGVHIHLCGR